MTIKLIRSLLVIAYDIKLCLDAVLLTLGIYWRKGMHVGVIRDSIDDLLDVRNVLSQDEATLKDLLKEIEDEG